MAYAQIHREKYDQRLNDKLVKLLAGMAKIFVADVVELGKSYRGETIFIVLTGSERSATAYARSEWPAQTVPPSSGAVSTGGEGLAAGAGQYGRSDSGRHWE